MNLNKGLCMEANGQSLLILPAMLMYLQPTGS